MIGFLCMRIILYFKYRTVLINNNKETKNIPDTPTQGLLESHNALAPIAPIIYISKPLSQSCAEQGKGFSSRAHMSCKHDGLNEESEKINNY